MRFGIRVYEPSCADLPHVTDQEIRWDICHCIKDILKTGRGWAGVRPGNAAVYVMAREEKHRHLGPYHVLILRGTEAYAADLTQEEADRILAGDNGEQELYDGCD